MSDALWLCVENYLLQYSCNTWAGVFVSEYNSTLSSSTLKVYGSWERIRVATGEGKRSLLAVLLVWVLGLRIGEQ